MCLYKGSLDFFCIASPAFPKRLTLLTARYFSSVGDCDFRFALEHALDSVGVALAYPSPKPPPPRSTVQFPFLGDAALPSTTACGIV